MFMRIGGRQHNNEFFWHVHSKATEKGSVHYNTKKKVNEGKGQGRFIGLTKQCHINVSFWGRVAMTQLSLLGVFGRVLYYHPRI